MPQKKGIKNKAPLTTWLLFLFTTCISAYAQSPTDSLLNLIKTTKDDTLKIMRLTELGNLLQNTNPDSAFKAYNDAIVLGTKVKSNAKDSLYIKAVDSKLIKTYNSLGISFQMMGNYDKSLKALFNSLELSLELQNPKIIGACLNNIGVVYMKMNDNELALNYYNKAVEVHRMNNNNRGLASVLNNIGMIYNRMGKYNEALKKFMEAKKINEESMNFEWLAANYSNIGETYYFKGMYDTAISFYFKAIKIEDKIGDEYGQVIEYGEIGINYLRLKKYDEAEKYLKLSIEKSENLDAVDLTYEYRYELSNMYSETRDFEKAYLELKQSMIEKDSVMNDVKSKEIGRLEATHEMEIKEIQETQKLNEEKKYKRMLKRRRNLIQYSGIIIFILLIALIISTLGFVKVSVATASGITFFSTLLLFEFILLLLDPIIDNISYNEPAIKLSINIIIAITIVPIHGYFEREIKTRLIKG